MDAGTRPELTPEQASDICLNQCRAQCCQGALILSLAAGEVEKFHLGALSLGLEVHLRPNPQGGAWLFFTDHSGQRCPMLDPDSAACRIYSQRPQRCRAFPERPTPGCLISGG